MLRLEEVLGFRGEALGTDENSDNSQARCDCMDSSTGKSCNTAYLHLYDLTRHEIPLITYTGKKFVVIYVPKTGFSHEVILYFNIYTCIWVWGEAIIFLVTYFLLEL